MHTIHVSEISCNQAKTTYVKVAEETGYTFRAVNDEDAYSFKMEGRFSSKHCQIPVKDVV